MTVNTPDATPASFGPVTVTFANGVLSTMTSTDPNITVTAAGNAVATLRPDFGSGAQAIPFNLATFGGASPTAHPSGLTQLATNAANEYTLSITQNTLKTRTSQKSTTP